MSVNIAGKILGMITAQSLKPGAQLPSINRLAEDFGVSNGTMREALTRLSALGLLDVHHGKGIFIPETSATDLFRAIAWKPIIEGVSVSEVLDARVAVESMTSRLAAARADAALQAEIDGFVERMETALAKNDAEEFIRLDERFHDTIAKASGNRLLQGFVTILREIISFARKTPPSREILEVSLNYHRQIARAIGEGEQERAGEATIHHIRSLEQKDYPQGIEIHCDGLGTGSFGGSFYTMGRYIAREVARATWIKPVVYITGGGIENVRMIQERRTILSITQAETAARAYFGREEFGEPCRDLRVLCCLPGLSLQIAVPASAGIHTLQDLRGKNVALGAHGSAAEVVARKILAACGLEENRDYIPQILALPAAIDLLNTDRVQAVCFLSAGPSAAFLEMTGSKPMDFLPLPEDVAEGFLKENPFWYHDRLAPQTYPGQSSGVATIGTPAILVTHKDLPDRDAYAVSSVVQDKIQDIAALTMTDFSASVPACEHGLPYHPGARKT